MTVTLYQTTNRKTDVSKTLTNGNTYNNVKIKEGTSIKNPTLIFSGGANNYVELSKNYAYIPAFNRYYFIEDKIIETGGRVEIPMKCDVLTTYATEIKNSTQLILRQENIGLNDIPDTQHPIAPYTNTRVIDFETTPFFNGLDNTTECFLLTVAGK